MDIEKGTGCKKEPGVFVVKVLACNQVQRHQSGGAGTCVSSHFTP